ncbi:hypothetical protein CCR75_003241 [Bremia lactucae]|uniref:ubiquitinyl hydrolase 1 n=1 Tax=Bremia lactucae TaxID=4779 RepID=A0A976FK54_BRELC|nr:hypothetical protein CCR75_003241 [Bremia lactucae]
MGTKRKREVESSRDARLDDPYLLHMPPCLFSNHHRKIGKNVGMVRNCVNNPNCLYGLGEHYHGIWQSARLIRRLYGSDPRERKRPLNACGKAMPCGLRNLGATCYLNSMLQCLYVNLPFRQAVYEWEPKEQLVDKALTLQMRALQKLFAQMQLGNESYYDPTVFASTLSLNRGMQQDAQEFSKLLLAHLRTIFWQSKIPRHWNLVDKLFQGQMCYVTKCLKCQNRSMRPSSYYEISLNIKGHQSVEDCVRSYLSPEVLNGENKYFCEHCDAKQCAERFLELKPQALPSTLMLHLMRFVYDAKAGRKKKLTDVIEINKILKMSELLRQSGLVEAPGPSEDVIYRLQGYLNHRGKSAHVGHYTATVAYPNLEKSIPDECGMDWYEFDDAVVTERSKCDARSERLHGSKIRSRDIYMLLYVRDDEATSGSTGQISSPRRANAILEPSELCRSDVEVLNNGFNAEVNKFVHIVSDMETRIQKRVDAYKHYFEASQPYPLATATQYYWVDTDWLRCWITGEDQTRTTLSLPHTEEEVLNLAAPEKKLEPNAAEQLSTFNVDDDHSTCVIVDRPEANIEAANAQCHEDDSRTTNLHCIDKSQSVSVDGGNVATPSTTSRSTSSIASSCEGPCRANAAEIDDEDIPFSKSVDVAPYCCGHSVGLKDGRQLQPILRFAPENVSKLKRISAEFFSYLQESCSQQPIVNDQTNSITSMRVFEAETYECTACVKTFRDTILNDMDNLNKVNVEFELLRDSRKNILATVAAEGAFLMSRAWIKSYKTHLQALHKVLSHAAFTCAKSAVKTSDDGLSMWQKPINEDITCFHGNLTLQKRLYRPVSTATWSYFRAKFSYRVEFAQSTTQPCAKCEIDENTNKECLQSERNTRNNILSVAALDFLYRQKTRGDLVRLVDMFELPAAQFGAGLERVSAWTKQKSTPRRMFLVSRRWLLRWREYIRNLEGGVPAPLSPLSITCSHHKLVLPPGLIAAQLGQLFNASSLEVELVTIEAMQALADRYGNPDMTVFYGLLKTIETDAGGFNVVWRRCSLASLYYENEKALSSNSSLDSIVAMDVQDANDEGILCAECQASSDRRHRDEIENFFNRVVTIQQLNENQEVPATENLTTDANHSGRRRSRRIRPGSVCTWPVVANATDTVYTLKANIYAEIGALPMHQRLYYKGQLLENNYTLKHSGIKAGDAVYMRLLEDSADDHVLDEEQEREVGFADSVLLSRPSTKCEKGKQDGVENTSSCTMMDQATLDSHESFVWVCSDCTFVNDDTDDICEMCCATKCSA